MLLGHDCALSWVRVSILQRGEAPKSSHATGAVLSRERVTDRQNLGWVRSPIFNKYLFWEFS
jgi:hypothetical protein